MTNGQSIFISAQRYPLLNTRDLCDLISDEPGLFRGDSYHSHGNQVECGEVLGYMQAGCGYYYTTRHLPRDTTRRRCEEYILVAIYYFRKVLIIIA